MDTLYPKSVNTPHATLTCNTNTLHCLQDLLRAQPWEHLRCLRLLHSHSLSNAGLAVDVACSHVNPFEFGAAVEMKGVVTG